MDDANTGRPGTGLPPTAALGASDLQNGRRETWDDPMRAGKNTMVPNGGGAVLLSVNRSGHIILLAMIYRLST